MMASAIVSELLAAYYGQFNQHVIDRLRLMNNHGTDKYQPGDIVKC